KLCLFRLSDHMAPEAKGTGPYSQLTHEELINLLEKQKQQLSQKDAKIGELELYIDSLLVRVMEESPNILMSLNPPNHVTSCTV
uniref:FIP-RBD domain-containing protein n=1 Tax=Sinocyclocheilus anshuiensis TaxID=1608454 RepID=A0A671SCU3_9TELE